MSACRSARINPYKVSTILLGAALLLSLGRDLVPSAEAASTGPLRLTKALAALKTSKKLLEEAKEPPAPFHQQSMMLVGQAIAAVEREIKAYEAEKEKKAKSGAKPDAKPSPAPAKKKEKEHKPAAASNDDGADG